MKPAPRPSIEAALRLNLTLSARQHPALTEELAALPKGPARTARLALLATLGLVVERGGAAAASSVAGAAAPPAPSVERAGGYVARLDAAALSDLVSAPGAPPDGTD